MSVFTSLNLRSSLLFLFLFLGNFTLLLAEEVPSGSVKVSYYADYFTGQRTANGEYYKPDEYTCAHTFYPFGTLLKLKKGKRAVIVRVNDRGPFVGNRVLDLSYVAAKDLGIVNAGVSDVSMELFDPTFYDTSDTILLAKVLSPDDKRFKLAMNVAKIEREAINKEKIAALDAKHAAKKGKKEKKEAKSEKSDKKEAKSEKSNKKEAKSNKSNKKDIARKSDKKEKTDKITEKQVKMSTKQREISAKEKKTVKDSISKKEKKNTNLGKELTEKEKIKRKKKEEKAAENTVIAAINTQNSIDEQKIEENEKKTSNLSQKDLEDSKKGFIFATDMSSVYHNKSSNWWIFPWIVVIIGTVFGVIVKNRE